MNSILSSSLYGPRQSGWRLLTRSIFPWRFYQYSVGCSVFSTLGFNIFPGVLDDILSTIWNTYRNACLAFYVEFSVFLYQVISVTEQWKAHTVLLLCTYYIFNKMYIITVSKYILHIWMIGCSIILQLQICWYRQFTLCSLHSN